MPKGLPISYIKKWGISKLAWKKFRAGALTKGVPTRTASIKKRLKGKNPRKGIKMTKKGKRRRSSGMTIPIAPILGLSAGLIQPVQFAMAGNYPWAFDIACKNYTGYSPMTKDWKIERMTQGVLPLALGLLVHKFIGGKPLNFNGMLARAKVPFIRI